MVWMNIDIKTDKCTIHPLYCYYVRKYSTTETIRKGVGYMKEDGGWMTFPNVDDAKIYHRSKYPELTLIIHDKCRGGK